MKILETSTDYQKAVYKILSSKPKYVYIATYGINFNSEFVKKVLKNLPKDNKLLLGLRDTTTTAQLGFYTRYFGGLGINVRMRPEFHAKLIVSDKGCIVGGRNLTDSDWTDASFVLTTKDSIKACKSMFEKIFKK